MNVLDKWMEKLNGNPLRKYLVFQRIFKSLHKIAYLWCNDFPLGLALRSKTKNILIMEGQNITGIFKNYNRWIMIHDKRLISFFSIFTMTMTLVLRHKIVQREFHLNIEIFNFNWRSSFSVYGVGPEPHILYARTTNSSSFLHFKSCTDSL